MAIERRYYEIEDECLGPDKKNRHWEMYLFLRSVTEYSRKTKKGIVRYVRRGRTIKTFEDSTKKGILGQVKKFCKRKDVVLLPKKGRH